MTTKTLTHADAIAILHAGTVPYVEYRTKDATLSHWLTVQCWLDSDGDLVQSHPTDSELGSCAAPFNARYSVPSAEQLAIDSADSRHWAAEMEAIERYEAAYADEINA